MKSVFFTIFLQVVCIRGFAADILPYLKEFKSHGQTLLEKVNKGEPIHANCGNFLQDLDVVDKGCRKPENTNGCRLWWVGYRENLAASRKQDGKVVMPNYVQYLNELEEHLQKCSQYNSEQMRQWLFDYLGVGGKKHIGSVGASGSKGRGHFGSGATLIYNELPTGGKGILYHTAIYVYGTVIDLDGTKGIFIDDKNTYEEGKDKANQARYEMPLQMNVPSLDRVQQIVDELTEEKFAPGKFFLQSNEKNCYGFTHMLLTKMAGEVVADQVLQGLKPTQIILDARYAFLMQLKRNLLEKENAFSVNSHF